MIFYSLKVFGSPLKLFIYQHFNNLSDIMFHPSFHLVPSVDTENIFQVWVSNKTSGYTGFFIYKNNVTIVCLLLSWFIRRKWNRKEQTEIIYYLIFFKASNFNVPRAALSLRLILMQLKNVLWRLNKVLFNSFKVGWFDGILFFSGSQKVMLNKVVLVSNVQILDSNLWNFGVKIVLKLWTQ